MLPSTLQCQFETWLLYFCFSFLLMSWEGRIVQMLGSLPLLGKAWMVFLLLGFGLAQPWVLWPFGERNSVCEDLSLPL